LFHYHLIVLDSSNQLLKYVLFSNFSLINLSFNWVHFKINLNLILEFLKISNFDYFYLFNHFEINLFYFQIIFIEFKHSKINLNLILEFLKISNFYYFYLFNHFEINLFYFQIIFIEFLMFLAFFFYYIFHRLIFNYITLFP